MARNHISLVSVIWEEKVDREIRISMPVVGERNVRFRACVRAVLEKGKIQIELEASRRRWRFGLADGCHTPIDWGIGRLRLCTKTQDGGVQLVLGGTVTIHTVSKHWPLISKDLRFVPLRCLTEGELIMLGFGEPHFGGFRLEPREEIGTLASDLTGAEQQVVLTQPQGS